MDVQEEMQTWGLTAGAELQTQGGPHWVGPAAQEAKPRPAAGLALWGGVSRGFAVGDVGLCSVCACVEACVALQIPPGCVRHLGGTPLPLGAS